MCQVAALCTVGCATLRKSPTFACSLDPGLIAAGGNATQGAFEIGAPASTIEVAILLSAIGAGFAGD